MRVAVECLLVGRCSGLTCNSALITRADPQLFQCNRPVGEETNQAGRNDLHVPDVPVIGKNLRKCLRQQFFVPVDDTTLVSAPSDAVSTISTPGGNVCSN